MFLFCLCTELQTFVFTLLMLRDMRDNFPHTVNICSNSLLSLLHPLFICINLCVSTHPLGVSRSSAAAEQQDQERRDPPPRDALHVDGQTAANSPPIPASSLVSARLGSARLGRDSTPHFSPIPPVHRVPRSSSSTQHVRSS